MAQHNELGKFGEQEAVNYLIQHGYTILERNWFFQKAEVDVIAKKEGVLAVVEVKTRSSLYFGNPQDLQLNAAEQRALSVQIRQTAGLADLNQKPLR